jgi:hypothetical protein
MFRLLAISDERMLVMSIVRTQRRAHYTRDSLSPFGRIKSTVTQSAFAIDKPHAFILVSSLGVVST